MAGLNVKDTARKYREVLGTLKDFQQATVKRIHELYRNGQKRVLVADEVGLGKTLVARGVIAAAVLLKAEQGNADMFRVVYVCSNMSIALQNLRRLDVFDVGTDNIDDTRLSMQHLKLYEDQKKAMERKYPVQLIPLTPETSFRMRGRAGNASERALIYVILKTLDEFQNNTEELSELMSLGVQSWADIVSWYQARVEKCNAYTAGEYLESLKKSIYEYCFRKKDVLALTTEYLNAKKDGGNQGSSRYEIIRSMRVMFANISVESLKPDLVIMDEFQRFKDLIELDHSDNGDETETGILVRNFLKGDNRVLLLSATPYKLYATLNEIEESGSKADHYIEFENVMKFLLGNGGKVEGNASFEEFKAVWDRYSTTLRELRCNDVALISLTKAKKAAEESMYQAVCRTERISAMESGDFTDSSASKKVVEITEGDIRSYLEFSELTAGMSEKIGAGNLVSYVESCPFQLSYLDGYLLKKQIEKEFEKKPEKLDNGYKKWLWLDPDAINNYEELPKANARLEYLKKEIFQNDSELYLWVPPSLPYYPLEGVYQNSAGFSKILLFSAWQMVPRMIQTLITYEAERLTFSKYKEYREKHAEMKGSRDIQYFTENKTRYPSSRITNFSMDDGEARQLVTFTMLYPCRNLAERYHPLDSYNKGESQIEIRRRIAAELKPELEKLESRFSRESRRDESWYWAAAMFLDEDSTFDGWYSGWLDILGKQAKARKESNDSDEEKQNENGFQKHLRKLKDVHDHPGNYHFGRMPDDLADVLVLMALASPAICLYRANGNDMPLASDLALKFVRRFDRAEAIVAIDLAMSKSSKDRFPYWRKVLHYCADGCFQGMVDEYMSLLLENAASDKDRRYSQACKEMAEGIGFRVANCSVDTYESLIGRNGDMKEKTAKPMMRASFAVGYLKEVSDSQGKNDDERSLRDRKNDIRKAFNSPLRPFVLASTSIGQEGLDFHCYCRKVMHWNLPSNPIDLEQREGRVNRYKGLAIRQNLALEARQYHYIFKQNVWNEIYEKAAEKKTKDQSDLVPFWCLGKNQQIKIERLLAFYPLSNDQQRYERLVRILDLYRVTLGQARQEELLEYLFSEFAEHEDKLKDKFINLSPYNKKGYPDEDIWVDEENAEETEDKTEIVEQVKNDTGRKIPDDVVIDESVKESSLIILRNTQKYIREMIGEERDMYTQTSIAAKSLKLLKNGYILLEVKTGSSLNGVRVEVDERVFEHMPKKDIENIAFKRGDEIYVADVMADQLEDVVMSVLDEYIR